MNKQIENLVTAQLISKFINLIKSERESLEKSWWLENPLLIDSMYQICGKHIKDGLLSDIPIELLLSIIPHANSNTREMFRKKLDIIHLPNKKMMYAKVG